LHHCPPPRRREFYRQEAESASLNRLNEESTLPVAAPEQLAQIRTNHQGRVGSSVARQQDYSSAQWRQLEQQHQAFSEMAAWSTERFDLGTGGEARYAQGLWVSSDFFPRASDSSDLGPAIVKE
jgi:hypothetical protein